MRKRLPTVLATPSPSCTSETPGQAAGGSPPTGFLRVYEERTGSQPSLLSQSPSGMARLSVAAEGRLKDSPTPLQVGR